MANTTITKILCRRGPEADRNDITPTMGEPIWTTDTHRFYVGDGETQGARPVVDLDTRYFEYKEVGPGEGELPESIPESGSTKHNVLSMASNIAGDISTSGRIISTNTAPADGVEPCDNGAIHADGGISCKKDIAAGRDVISFCTSDIQFKDNVKDIENPLKRIQQISGVTFEWNDKQSVHRGADTGLIAQQVEALQLPGVCTTRDDGTKAIKYERIVPLLVECVKELSEKIQRLENQHES